MDQVTDRTVRDGNGRFAPGSSGNPKGKAPGTRNRATVLRALMRDGDEDAIGRVLIERALGGDPVAARFLIDGLNPKPRQRTITLDLPEGADAAAIFRAATKAMAASEISPEEARSVVRFLEEGQRMVRAAARLHSACNSTVADEALSRRPTEQRVATPLPDLPPQGGKESDCAASPTEPLPPLRGKAGKGGDVNATDSRRPAHPCIPPANPRSPTRRQAVEVTARAAKAGHHAARLRQGFGGHPASP
jgi:hypothetical protein